MSLYHKTHTHTIIHVHPVNTEICLQSDQSHSCPHNHAYPTSAQGRHISECTDVRLTWALGGGGGHPSSHIFTWPNSIIGEIITCHTLSGSKQFSNVISTSKVSTSILRVSLLSQESNCSMLESEPASCLRY